MTLVGGTQATAGWRQAPTQVQTHAERRSRLKRGGLRERLVGHGRAVVGLQ